MTLHRTVRPSPIEPRFNPEATIAEWPFRPTAKNDGDLVLSNIGTFHDHFCRCRGCKPSLAGEMK